MARFPETAPIPTPRPLGGAFPDFPPPPPPARLIPPAGGKPGYGQDMTLDALMARQQELAAQQGQVMRQGASNIPQGLAQMAWTLVNALGERKAAKAEAEGRAEVGEAFKSFDPATGMLAPEAMETIMRRAPDTGLDLYKTAMALRASQAKQDVYGPVITGEAAKNLGLDPTKAWQLNLTTNQYDQAGGGGTNITIGGEKLTEQGSNVINYYTRGGLANEDLNEQEQQLTSQAGAWLQKVPLGNFYQDPKYQTAVRAGKDFLAMVLRKDTGAAVTQQEFEQYADLYLPLPGDSPENVAAKRQARQDVLDTLALSVEGAAPGTLEKANALVANRRKQIQERKAGVVNPNQPPDQVQSDPATLPSVPAGDTAAFQALPAGAKYTVPGDINPGTGKPYVYTKGAQ